MARIAGGNCGGAAPIKDAGFHGFVVLGIARHEQRVSRKFVDCYVNTQSKFRSIKRFDRFGSIMGHITWPGPQGIQDKRKASVGKERQDRFACSYRHMNIALKVFAQPFQPTSSGHLFEQTSMNISHHQ